jgi:hypothetical protein
LTVSDGIRPEFAAAFWILSLDEALLVIENIPTELCLQGSQSGTRCTLHIGATHAVNSFDSLIVIRRASSPRWASIKLNRTFRAISSAEGEFDAKMSTSFRSWSRHSGDLDFLDMK